MRGTGEGGGRISNWTLPNAQHARAVLIELKAMEIFSVRPRTRVAVSSHWFSYVTDWKDTALVCASLLRTRKFKKKKKKKKNGGKKRVEKVLVTFNNESEITSKEILFPVRRQKKIHIS